MKVEDITDSMLPSVKSDVAVNVFDVNVRKASMFSFPNVNAADPV